MEGGGGGGGGGVPPIPTDWKGPLFDPLASLFEGRPRTAATLEVAKILHSSENPVVASLGEQFARDVRNRGAVLSSRADIKSLFGPQIRAAEATLREQGYGAAETSALTSAIYGSGGHLTHRQIRTFDTAPNVPSAPPPPPSAPPPPLESVPRFNFQPSGLFGALPQLAPQAGAAIGYLTEGAPGGTLGYEMGKMISQADQFFGQLTRPSSSTSAPRRQAGAPPPSQMDLIPRGQPAPLLDTTSPCPSCGPIRAQETELEEEIQTELEQQAQSHAEQRQQQIDQFRQLERQPVEQRDIPTEIARKQQLLQQARQDEAQLTSHQPSAPLPQGQAAPTLANNQPSAPPSAPPSAQPSHAQPEPVTLCLTCESQAEALKFLNGQPASCVVAE